MNVLIQFNDDVAIVEGHLDEAANWVRKDLPPGTASWNNKHVSGACVFHLTFTCPCGCGDVLFLPVREGPKKERAWQWDGNRELPTLEPSIQRLGRCNWHGHLKKGIFDAC